MGYIELEGADWKKITGTILTSYTVLQLDTLINQQFPQVHRAVRWQNPAEAVVFELAGAANRLGILDQVILLLSDERSGRPDLRGLVLFYSQFSGWGARLETNDLEISDALEHLTTSGNPFINTSHLTNWLTAVERQVCQVRCGQQFGTGFLVSPDLVMTCYHVVQSHLDGSTPPDEVQVRFDFRRIKPDVEPEDTDTWITIDSKWEIPNEPYSKVDLEQNFDSDILPKGDELDYALLRLDRQVGFEYPIGESGPRGWIDLSTDPAIPGEPSPMLIVQHPRRESGSPPQMPLQIAFSTPGFESLNKNHTRMVYTPSTKKGSSGSPVFDGRLNPVALHHNLGQPNEHDLNFVKNNRGIPLRTIVSSLADDVRTQLIESPSS